MIYTIKEIKFSGKWVEFWFKESSKASNGFDKSCKIYMLEELIDKKDLRDKVTMNGYEILYGMQVEWEKDRPVRFVMDDICDKEYGEGGVIKITESNEINNNLKYNLFTSNITSYESYTTFNLPLQMIWNPKEDITTYELAQCMPYFNRHVYPYEIYNEMKFLRHFDIIDHNKKENYGKT